MSAPIQLPDIRQSDGYDCGMAVRDAVLTHHGRATDGLHFTATAYDGTSPDLIELSLREAGLPVLAGQMDIPLLRYLTGVGRPVICPVSDFGGHWIAVVGVTAHRVLIHCPLRGAHSYKKADFNDRWHDTTRRAHTYDHWGIA